MLVCLSPFDVLNYSTDNYEILQTSCQKYIHEYSVLFDQKKNTVPTYVRERCRRYSYSSFIE